MSLTHKRFPLKASDELGTGIYFSYSIGKQPGGYRVFILGSGRLLVYTKLKVTLKEARKFARREIARRDKQAVSRAVAQSPKKDDYLLLTKRV